MAEKAGTKADQMKQGNTEEYEEKQRRAAEKEKEKKAMNLKKIRIRAAIY